MYLQISWHRSGKGHLPRQSPEMPVHQRPHTPKNYSFSTPVVYLIISCLAVSCFAIVLKLMC